MTYRDDMLNWMCHRRNLKVDDVQKAILQWNWLERNFLNARRNVLKAFKINPKSRMPEDDHTVYFGRCRVTNPYPYMRRFYDGGHEPDIVVARLGTPFYCYETDTLLVCTKEALEYVHEEPPFGWTFLPNKYEKVINQYNDAAEFEARVAAMLADRDFADSGTTCELCPFYGEDNCSDTYRKKYHHNCLSDWSRLKEARIYVEEEMDR